MNVFTKHPHSIGEGYFQHMRFALTYGSKMVGGGLACMVHAIFPFIFQTTGSRMAVKLSEKFLTRGSLDQHAPLTEAQPPQH